MTSFLRQLNPRDLVHKLWSITYGPWVPVRFDQIEIIFEQFRFWLVHYKLYFEKVLKTLFFYNFLTVTKNPINYFKTDPEKWFILSRDFLMAVEITLKPESRDYSLKLPVSKSPAQKFHLYFLLEILKIMCFLEKKFE